MDSDNFQELLDKGQKILADDVKILSEGQKTLSEGQDVLRQNMARMEFQLIEKIDALSDGQQVFIERQNTTDGNIKYLVNTLDYIANKVDHIAADTSLLVGRVTRLEKANNL